MIRKIDNKNMGKSNLGWLQSSFHFSFAEYYNPLNINFGSLRVINDDLIQPQSGFPTHPHRDMEIVTYLVSGKLTHKDSMGNERTLERGEVQYMSAGTGVYHSEFNMEENEDLRLLQIWVFPDATGYEPNYGDMKFNWDDRVNNWLHMVSSTKGDAPIKIHQDMNIYSLFLEEGKTATFNVDKNRQAYLVQIEGNSIINSVELNEKDAMEIVEENLTINAKSNSHFLVLEMRKAILD